MKKIKLMTVVLTTILLASNIASAQYYTSNYYQQGDYDNVTANICLDIQNNLRYQSVDQYTTNEVSKLQDFLIDSGYMTGNTSGYFGLLTLKAVKSYQSAKGLASTGYVGPLTRQNIKTDSCNSYVINNPSPVIVNPTTPGICTMEARICSDGSTMPRDANCNWHAEYCPVTNYNYNNGYYNNYNYSSTYNNGYSNSNSSSCYYTNGYLNCY